MTGGQRDALVVLALAIANGLLMWTLGSAWDAFQQRRRDRREMAAGGPR